MNVPPLSCSLLSDNRVACKRKNEKKNSDNTFVDDLAPHRVQ